MTWRLIIDEYEGAKDGTEYDDESFAEIEGIIRTLTGNSDTGFRRAVRGRVLKGDRKWFDLRWAPTTKTHWLEYSPPGEAQALGAMRVPQITIKP